MKIPVSKSIDISFLIQALTLGKEPATLLIYSVWVESVLTGLDFLTGGIHKYCRHVEAISYFDCYSSSDFMCSQSQRAITVQ